jgi:hypothetical protein
MFKSAGNSLGATGNARIGAALFAAPVVLRVGRGTGTARTGAPNDGVPIRAVPVAPDSASAGVFAGSSEGLNLPKRLALIAKLYHKIIIMEKGTSLRLRLAAVRQALNY